MQVDPEISAMNDVLEVFKYLQHDERLRIVDWIKARFNLIDKPKPKEIPPPAVPAEAAVPEAPAAPEAPAPPAAPEAPAAPETPAPPAPIDETIATEETQIEEIEETETPPETEQDEPGPPPEPETTGVNFEEFDSIEELFLTSDVKKVSHRILLAAAYLQEKNDLTEVSSLEINTQLKKLGYGVTNITTLINGLLNKKPPLMEVTKKEGTTKQARRKFKVTEPGFDVARNFVKET